MNNVLEFLADNYIWFMIGGIVLLIALIGFVIDGGKKKKEDVSASNETNVDNNIPTQETNTLNVQNSNVETPVIPQEEVSESQNEVNTFGEVKVEPVSFEIPSVENVSEVKPEPVMPEVKQTASNPVQSAPTVNTYETPVQPVPSVENISEESNVINFDMPVLNEVNPEPVMPEVNQTVSNPAQTAPTVDTFEVPTQSIPIVENVNVAQPIEIPRENNDADNTTPLV